MDVSTHSHFVVKATLLSLFLLTPSDFGIGPEAFKAPIVWFRSSAIAAAPAAPEKGKALLDDLVQKARQEGEVVATIQSSWNKALVQPLADAFKKRFGLDIKVTIANMRPAQHFPVAIAETQARAPATYDSVQGDDAEIMQLIGAGGTQRIENWEALLAEINPMVRSGKVKPAQISRGPILQHAFLVYANIKQIVYNTKLISEAELPKTHAELAEPKYKGKFTQPPWTSHWEIAPVVFDNFEKDKWLDVVRRAGRNTSAVLPETTGVQRVVLGEFPFALAQDTYFRQILLQDPKAPIGFKFFEDYNEKNAVYYAVRTGAKRPAAATLFALWMTTPEAQAIWQPGELLAVPHGESKIDREHARSIQNSRAKIVGFFDNDRTAELLRWYQTEEGRKYLDSMTRAIRGE
jgi:ABC-type Fe3+ transport system substrate-binding protein